MASANLRHIDALLELRSALLSFRSSTADVPVLIARRIDQTERRLDAARALAERERETALRQLVNRREDDDADGALRDAENRIERLSGLTARFDRARGRFEHHAPTFNTLADRIIPKAVLSLQKSAELAGAYLTVRPPSHSAAGSDAATGSTDMRTGSAHRDAHPSRAVSSADLPALPEGFEWFSIDGFADADLPKATDPSKGVTEGQMRRGIERLWTEVMPLLRGGPIHQQRARCEQFDREHNRVDRRGFVHPESVAAIWDAFFNTATSSQIRIELSSMSGNVTVTNGRHRIKEARALGWLFIPAQVIRKG